MTTNEIFDLLKQRILQNNEVSLIHSFETQANGKGKWVLKGSAA